MNWNRASRMGRGGLSPLQRSVGGLNNSIDLSRFMKALIEIKSAQPGERVPVAPRGGGATDCGK